MSFGKQLEVALAESPRFSVLYLEAFPLQRHALANYLAGAVETSFELAVVTCAKDAAQEIDSGQHDILLLDIGPTVETAVENFRLIRQCRRKLPTIAILPVAASFESARELAQLGAQEYIRQDQLNHRTLFRSIRRALNPAKLSDELFDHRSIDGLTSLANAATFGDRLRQALTRDDRFGEDVALVLLDIDDFASINQQFRYTMGNAVLLETAYRLVDCVRKQDTVARVGSNLFAIILESVKTLPVLQDKVNAIVRRLAQPYTVGEQEARVFVSVGAGLRSGLAHCGSHAFVDAVELELMNAKRRGGNCVHIAALENFAAQCEQQTG